MQKIPSCLQSQNKSVKVSTLIIICHDHAVSVFPQMYLNLADLEIFHVQVDVDSGYLSVPGAQVTLHCQEEVEWLEERALGQHRTTHHHTGIQ